jgi:hypothetical protein
MAALTDLQRLQARVEELERWVYGPGGALGSRKVRSLFPCLVSGAGPEQSIGFAFGMDATASVQSRRPQPTL